MKLYLILIILFISTFAQAEVVNTVKLGTPIRNLDSVTLAIEGYSFYITPQKIDIVRYDKEIIKFDIQTFADVLKYAKDITPEQIEFMRYKLESYDVTKFDVTQWVNYIVTYDSVINYGKELMDAVKSVRVSHYINTKDYIKLQTELAGVIPADKVQALVKYIEGNMPTQLSPQPFFIGIGECDNLTKIKSAISKKEIDCLLVPVYEIKEDILNEIFKVVVNTDKQIIFAFDFEYEDVGLLQLIGKIVNKVNISNEPLIHSVIVLWGKQNSIDLSPDRYAECGKIAEKIIAYLKSQAPNIYVYRQICFYPGEGRDKKWDEAIQIKADGDWWWGPHFFNTLMGMNLNLYYRRISKDKPIVVGGFLGDTYNLWTDKEIGNTKERKDRFIEYVKGQNVNGVCFIGIDNWLKILK